MGCKKKRLHEEDVAAGVTNSAADSAGFPPALLSFHPDRDLGQEGGGCLALLIQPRVGSCQGDELPVRYAKWKPGLQNGV